VGPACLVLEMKVRALFVSTRLKEFTTGVPQEITDRLFVVRPAFRVNDSLPAESALRGEWQGGGWLLVDRGSGRTFWADAGGLRTWMEKHGKEFQQRSFIIRLFY